MDGDAGADVLAEHADIGRQAAAGNLFAGEDLDQLLFATGGVLGGEDLEHIGALANGGAHGGDGFGLVVLDADQHLLRLDQVFEYLDARHQLRRLLAHQQVIGGDIGLAFGAVDDQRANRLRGWRGQLHRGGEAGTAEAVDTSLTDDVQQIGRRQLAVIGVRLQFDPLVPAIAVDDDGRRGHARDVRVGLRADEADGARCGRMHRRADEAAGLGDQLALEHLFAERHARFGGRAQVLGKRHDQPRRQRHPLDRRAVGQLLALRRMDAAMDVPDVQRGHAACSRSLAISWPGASGWSHFQLCRLLPSSIMSMQSTGQGSTQRSQPVHSVTITVCICLAAPTMASTGQAWMHLVQPMHSASRI